MCLLSLVSVNEFAWDLFFTRDTFEVELLSHAVGMESGLAVWALSRFVVQVEYLLTDADRLEFWQQLVARCCSCLTADVPLTEEEVV